MDLYIVPTNALRFNIKLNYKIYCKSILITRKEIAVFESLPLDLAAYTQSLFVSKFTHFLGAGTPTKKVDKVLVVQQSHEVRRIR